MAFIDHIHACNRHDPGRFIPFRVDGLAVGMVTGEFAGRVAGCGGDFSYTTAGLDYRSGAGSLAERSGRFASVLQLLVEQGHISHLHGEQYVATPGSREQGVLLVDRAAAPYFGIRAFGQHVNGYVRDGSDWSMWVGRRAADRRNYPGRLDNLAAGGLPFGITLQENLKKECWEEAGVSAPLAATARPVGAVTYCMDGAKGCKPDTLYCYDLELPRDFVPVCTDGEVEEFLLLPIAEVMDLVADSDAFKLNCNLVIIDFLIRHGHIGPEQADYLELVRLLHRPLPVF